MFAVRYLSRLAATGAFAMFLSFGGDRAEALYDVEPGEISGKPGTLIRVWPLESGGPGIATRSAFFTAPPDRRARSSRSQARSSSLRARAFRWPQHHRLGAPNFGRRTGLRAIAVSG